MIGPGSEFAGYRIERELGRGGMGVVYEAFQVRLNRAVALKVLSPELSHDAEFQERFRREGLAQAAVEHPHIIPVYEASEADSLLFLAMRLVRGPTLKDLIRSGELTPERSLSLLRQVADGLDAAHRAGLVHRDVKPQNVLVDTGDHAYLADFGLTRALAEGGLTRTGQYFGTPQYIAPEQVNGTAVSPATDIYALAAVVFECLTGKVPFERDTHQAVLFAHVFDGPPKASAARPDLPAAVDAVIERGMAKDPGARQPSARALVEETARALGAAAVATLPPASAPARMAPTAAASAPPVRRRRGLRPRVLAGAAAGVAAAAIAAALLAGGGSSGDDGSGGSGSATTSVPPPPPATGPQPSGVSHAAGVVTLGSDLRMPASGDKWFCTGSGADTPCTFALTRLPEDLDRPATSPFDGVVTRWQVQGALGPIRLVVLRGDVRPGAESRLRRVAGSDGQEIQDERRHAFDTRLPIRKGDVTGLQFSVGASGHAPYAPKAYLEVWVSQGPLGVEPRLSEEGSARDYELLYNAYVERDRDGDGYGDVTQDRCPGDPRRHEGC